jgi:hypothetical protein
LKIVYYNCEITEQAVGENQNSCVLAAETSNAYAQRVAQMEQDSFDDAWTEAMVADSLAQSHNHLWLVEDDAGTPCGYLLANVMKIIGKSYHFRLFFIRNIKILLCEGTQQP